MPGPTRFRGEGGVHAASSGKFFHDALDNRVREVLHLVNYCAGSGVPENAPEETRDLPGTRKLLRRLASESVVLLKNEGQLLPLSKDKKVQLYTQTGATSNDPATNLDRSLSSALTVPQLIIAVAAPHHYGPIMPSVHWKESSARSDTTMLSTLLVHIRTKSSQILASIGLPQLTCLAKELYSLHLPSHRMLKIVNPWKASYLRTQR